MSKKIATNNFKIAPTFAGLEKGSPKTDRIVWTYNAPRSGSPSHSNCGSVSGSEHNLCHASTISSSSSSQRSLSPVSPTSVSSSIMSSNSNSLQQKNHQPEIEMKPQSNHNSIPDHWNPTSDVSASEAVSNISSPDYQEEITMDILNARDLMMEISDPSDSDSTLLVSDPVSGSQNRSTANSDKNEEKIHRGKSKLNGKPNCFFSNTSDHKIIIQVKGPETTNVIRNNNNFYQEKETTEQQTNSEVRIYLLIN